MKFKSNTNSNILIKNIKLVIKPSQIEPNNFSASDDDDSVVSKSSRIDSEENVSTIKLNLCRSSCSDNKLYDKENNSESHNLIISRSNKTEKESLRKKTKENTPSICVTFCRYPIISKVAKLKSWKLVKKNDLWNILWTDSIQSVESFKDIKRFQRINHFPGMSEICRKDLLARNLNRMLKLFPSEFDIFPKTWCFPADLGEAIAFAKESKIKTFIIKPDQGAQGKGIWLTKNLKDIKPNERMICQAYINRPLLIDGYKFDLRIYVLVTSVDPLRIFVHKEGLARFATNKYKEPTYENTSNIFMHLTNYSVNKHSRTFSKDNELGSKRKISVLNRLLLSEGYDIKSLWQHIDDIIIKTILSALPILKHNYHVCFPMHNIMQGCFEILGFDIIIDSKLKPYILEVNHSPSFHTDEKIDTEVKELLLKDTFNILNLSHIDKRKIINDDRKRVQSRLLSKIKDTNNVNASTNNENLDGENKTLINTIKQQIEWEETHLGGFRRIMPPTDNNCNKYKQFHIVYDQSSMYAKTAASKRREEAAKQLRQEILEKENKLQKFLKQSTNNNNKILDKMNKNSKYAKLFKKRKYEQIMRNKNWMMGNFIINSDERERILALSGRDLLVKNSGILNIIIETFYQLNLLNESDFIKYGEELEKITNSRNQNNQNKNQLGDHSIEDPLEYNSKYGINIISLKNPNMNKR